MTLRKGFTLLEAMVALVILGLVSLSYLELFGGTVRATESAAQWSRAVEYAEDGMESLKVAPEQDWNLGPEQLADGFSRRVEMRPWRDELRVVSVIVSLPGGGELAVSRLMGAW